MLHMDVVRLKHIEVKYMYMWRGGVLHYYMYIGQHHREPGMCRSLTTVNLPVYLSQLVYLFHLHVASCTTDQYDHHESCTSVRQVHINWSKLEYIKLLHELSLIHI